MAKGCEKKLNHLACMKKIESVVWKGPQKNRKQSLTLY